MSTKLPSVPPARRAPAAEPPNRAQDSKQRPPLRPSDPKQAQRGAVEQNTRNTGYKQDR